MKSFAIETRKLSNPLSRSSSLHAPSNDDCENAANTLRGVGAETPSIHLRESLQSVAITHFTATAVRERSIDGSFVQIVIPPQENKLVAAFGVKLAQDGQNVIVEHVFHDCAAEKAGLMVLDRICQINGEEVHSVARAKALMETQSETRIAVHRLCASAAPSNMTPLHT